MGGKRRRNPYKIDSKKWGLGRRYCIKRLGPRGTCIEFDMWGNKSKYPKETRDMSMYPKGYRKRVRKTWGSRAVGPNRGPSSLDMAELRSAALSFANGKGVKPRSGFSSAYSSVHDPGMDVIVPYKGGRAKRFKMF